MNEFHRTFKEVAKIGKDCYRVVASILFSLLALRQWHNMLYFDWVISSYYIAHVLSITRPSWS